MLCNVSSCAASRVAAPPKHSLGRPTADPRFQTNLSKPQAVPMLMFYQDAGSPDVVKAGVLTCFASSTNTHQPTRWQASN